MSGGKLAYVCYLKPMGHEPSDMARGLLNQLPGPIQRQIRCVDYFQVCEEYGKSKPAWLNGAPVLATYAEPPEVFKGSAAISQIRKIAANVARSGIGGGGAGGGGRMHPGHGGAAGMGARTAPPSRSGASSAGGMAASAAPAPMGEAIPAAPVGSVGVYGAIATDELYQSVMPNKMGGGRELGGGRGGNKQKLADAAAEWEAARQGMMS